jgi:hypothetical protein
VRFATRFEDAGDGNKHKERQIMNKPKTRNAALALVGVLALSIYILACTSFSPDDTKVLYPAFDAPSGAIGMAVYDREARGSEMLFLPVDYDTGESNIVTAPSILRAQWLANGRDIVVAYSAGDNSSSEREGLSVAMIPWGARKPIKLFRVPNVKEVGQLFMLPLCIAGERVLLRTGSKGVARLDLRTGALTGHEFEDAKGEISLYPAPDGANVFYFESENQPEQKTVFGRLSPNDFSRTPLMVITNQVRDQSVVAYDNAGRVLAILGGDAETNELLVLRDGQTIFARSLDARGQERRFGNAILAASGKALWATFQQAKGTNSVSYGLMEIPFSDVRPRELTLINDAPQEDEPAVFYFQAAISHDGKTAAIASTYLACTEKEFKSADCALFLVDLSDPKWKVTKVPIPVPAKRLDLMH